MDGVFEEVKNRLGFGCMRFPLTDNKDIDMEQVKRMVDLIRERAICWRTSCPTASSRRRRTYSPSSRDSWSAVESSISTTI